MRTVQVWPALLSATSLAESARALLSTRISGRPLPAARRNLSLRESIHSLDALRTYWRLRPHMRAVRSETRAIRKGRIKANFTDNATGRYVARHTDWSSAYGDPPEGMIRSPDRIRELIWWDPAAAERIIAEAIKLNAQHEQALRDAKATQAHAHAHRFADPAAYAKASDLVWRLTKSAPWDLMNSYKTSLTAFAEAFNAARNRPIGPTTTPRRTEETGSWRAEQPRAPKARRPAAPAQAPTHRWAPPPRVPPRVPPRPPPPPQSTVRQPPPTPPLSPSNSLWFAPANAGPEAAHLWTSSTSPGGSVSRRCILIGSLGPAGGTQQGPLIKPERADMQVTAAYARLSKRERS